MRNLPPPPPPSQTVMENPVYKLEDLQGTSWEMTILNIRSLALLATKIKLMSFFTKPENEGFQYSVLQLLSSTQFFSQIVIGKGKTGSLHSAGNSFFMAYNPSFWENFPSRIGVCVYVCMCVLFLCVYMYVRV